MAYETLLSSIGFSPKETKLYETLLTNGRSNVPTLVKELNEKRGVVHFLLNSLFEKGLVRKLKTGKEIVVSPEHPSKLQELLEKKEKTFESTKENLLISLPSMISEYNLSTDKPGVYYFEGVEGVKK